MGNTFKIASIHIYPIKGLKGIEVKESQLLERGLEHDRRWMLIDSNSNFISQREFSQLSLFQCSMKGDQIHVSYGESSISWDIDLTQDVKRELTIWDEEEIGMEVSDAVSEWFSDKLGMKCTLVKMVDEYDRIKPLKKGRESTKLSFADGYPVLILGTASMDLLNEKSSKEILPDRFRSNIIIETNVAHEEDHWDIIQIGDASLQVIKACVRCQVIMIDQSTGIADKEVLKALSTYRKEGNEVRFCANVICLTEGKLDQQSQVVLSK